MSLDKRTACQVKKQIEVKMNFLNKIRPKNLVKLSILFSVIIFLCVNIITNNVLIHQG